MTAEPTRERVGAYERALGCRPEPFVYNQRVCATHDQLWTDLGCPVAVAAEQVEKAKCTTPDPECPRPGCHGKPGHNMGQADIPENHRVPRADDAHPRDQEEAYIEAERVAEVEAPSMITEPTREENYAWAEAQAFSYLEVLRQRDEARAELASLRAVVEQVRVRCAEVGYGVPSTHLAHGILALLPEPIQSG